jgi:hypothetical protein
MQPTTRRFVIIAFAAVTLVLALQVAWTGSGHNGDAAAPPQTEAPPPAGELPEFQPSEELAADAAVAFPADI